MTAPSRPRPGGRRRRRWRRRGGACAAGLWGRRVLSRSSWTVGGWMDNRIVTPFPPFFRRGNEGLTREMEDRKTGCPARSFLAQFFSARLYTTLFFSSSHRFSFFFCPSPLLPLLSLSVWSARLRPASLCLCVCVERNREEARERRAARMEKKNLI